MIKRIFSKKSGFTLVEVVVAFVVFAIMAAMILQILNLVLYERKINNETVAAFYNQEELIAVNSRTGTYNEANQTGTMTFDFGTDGSYAIGYESVSPDGSDSGLMYYIGPGSEDDDSVPTESVTPSTEAGSQMNRLDTRITGTTGFNDITVFTVQKDDSYVSTDSAYPNAVRYFFEVSADGGDMANEMVPYAQYKMYFYMEGQYSSVETTDSDGNTVTQLIPVAATILDGGYVNSAVLSYSDSTCKAFDGGDSGTSTYNKYIIKILNENCVRIGSPYVTGNSNGAQITEYGSQMGIRFSSGEFSRFYLIFAEDPQLTINSFGEDFGAYTPNVVESPKASGGYKVEYSKVPILDSDGDPTDSYYANIYGAFKKKTAEAEE